MDPEATGTLNARWAGLLIEEFARCGVETVVFSSGFRNAPLVLAADAHPDLQCVSHYDERGAAFFALGWGRAARKPALWITTSGTAAANGYPAVIEAAMDRVPLVCLTADRPAEMRESGANQVIDQHGLFGRYAGWFVDLPPPGTVEHPSYLQTTVNQAYHRAQSGPVHLNCQYREPLVARKTGPLGDKTTRPYTRYVAPRKEPPALGQLAEQLSHIKRGLIVAGRLASAKEGAAALHLAEQLGWPLLPDVTSQVQSTCASDTPCIANFDLCLKSAEFQDKCRVEAVLQLGGPFVSRGLLEYLLKSRPKTWIVVNQSAVRIDPLHQVTDKYEADVTQFCQRLGERIRRAEAEGLWLSTWRDASSSVEKLIAQELDTLESAQSEPFVARSIAHLIPDGSTLAVASSMPIRDLAMFRSARQLKKTVVVANRGASGIEGMVATATGLAQGTGGLVTLLVGDLALLHDLNSLALVRDKSVIIVVLNNNGGGIFHLLPIPKPQETIESCFGTPHGLGFEFAARMFGLNYVCSKSRKQFAAAYKQAITKREPVIIEVTTDRTQNADEHQRLYAMVKRELST